MRMFVVSLLLLGIISTAWATHAISSVDERKIQDQIGKATPIEFELQEANAALNKQQNSPQTVAALRAKIKKLEEQRADVYNKAIWMAIEYYGILDPGKGLPEGEIVKASPNRGDVVKWAPIFDVHSDHNIVDAKGNSIAKDKLWDASGIASSDGISRIFPENFSSPAELVSTIVHEKKHFDQFTSRGQGDVMTPGELEPPAVDEELDLQRRGVIVFPDWRVDEWKKERKKYRAQKEAQGRDERVDYERTGILPTSNFPESKVKKELQRIQKDADSLRKQVSTELGLSLLHKTAESVCNTKIGAGLGSSTGDFSRACKFLRGGSAPVSDPAARIMKGCQSEVLSALLRCPHESEIDKIIDEERRAGVDEAIYLLQQLSGGICRDPATPPFPLYGNQYNAYCDKVKNNPSAWALVNEAYAGWGGCERSVATILDTCKDEAAIHDRLETVLRRKNPPKAQPPDWNAVKRSELEKSKTYYTEELTGAYQKLVNITSELCRDPDNASFDSDEFCRNSTKASRIVEKYDEVGLYAPASIDDTENGSECGLSLLREILKDHPKLGCQTSPNGDDLDGGWVRRRAGELRPHPAQPPSPKPMPRDPGNGGNGGGGARSPAQVCEENGCKWSGVGRRCLCDH